MRLTNLVNSSPTTSHVTPQSFISLKEYFEHNEWKYEFDDENQVVNTHLNGETGQFRVVAVISADNDLLETAAYLPCKVPPESRHLAAEFCVRASYGLKIGRLELDFEDGTVRLHVGSLFADGELDKSIIHQSVGAAVLWANRYNSHLLSTIYGTITPKEAVRNADLPFMTE